LECPLCGQVVVDGDDDIVPGACPGCGARYEGGEGDAPASVAAAVTGFGVDDLDAREVLDAVFRLTPAQSAERGVSITSDTRDDFYRWWLFVRAGESGDPAEVLRQVVGR
jgi:predicted  nucleic acid-binding Zn-ribbon protein